jgi:hypothetical protein
VNHDALVGIAATAHAAVLLGALAAYYKFGDRTEIVARSLRGIDDTLRELRRLIAADLADALREDLIEDASVAAAVTAHAYVERPAPLFASERYRESVREFVERSTSRMVDCRSLVLGRDAWSRAASRLSWTLLTLVGYQACVAGLLVFLDKTGVVQFPDSLVIWAAAPTAVLILSCGLWLVLVQRKHDIISDIRQRYAE